VTTDFGFKTLSDQIMPVFSFHDSKLFELHFFSFSSPLPEIAEKLASYGMIHDLHKLTTFDAAHEINFYGIDVLIDLKGHS